jgi:NodT family efflux transporter outer membrane factor (OMF) lipoprotein
VNLKLLRKPSVACLAALLAGCALQPAYEQPAATIAGQWQTRQPHGGSIELLADWWQRFDDKAVAALVRRAESDSPTLAQALAQIDGARAALTSAGASSLPALSAGGSVTRSKQVATGVTTSRSGGLDASWELDLFGRQRSGRESARAQLQARIDDWHDARVSLAAEVADSYVQYRACHQLAAAYQAQADSQAQTLRATRVAVSAGLNAPTDGYLAEANAASAQEALAAQQVQCELLVKSLVALTGMEEPALRGLIDRAQAIPQPADFEVRSLPADLLRQRPDLASSERTLAARYAEIGQARADRWPSLTLGGSISISATSLITPASSWSFGPSLNLPLFDGGRRRAAVDSAEAVYEQQLAVYRGAVRSAVSEVEQALVQLEGAALRSGDARTAAEQYRRYASAAEANWRAGLDSLLTLEQARRSAIAAELTDIQLRRDRVRAWIALYKSLGGGWTVAQQEAITQGAAS